MTTRRYFAYGSNMLGERLRRRVPSATRIGRATLLAHRLAFHKRGWDGSAKCSVVAAPSSVVHGVVYTLAAREQVHLDRVEGLGQGYDEHLVEVVGRGGRAIRAFTYIAMPGHTDDELRPYDWYRALVLAGARENALPADYVEAIGRVVAKPDPDAERAAANRMILRAAGWGGPPIGPDEALAPDGRGRRSEPG